MSDKFERFGNYILLDKLNAGGMAEVFLAKSLGASGVNKFVAIKRILPQFSDNKEFIDMFKSEAKIAVNLHHSNVASIIDFKAERGQLYLVMEYMQGHNLRQLLQQKKRAKIDLSLPFIVYIAREVAAGLDHAHRCMDKTSNKPLDIIHRDMSPQNIMISYDGEVKVIDFGIAKAETALETTRAGTLKGKFSYMSPEQAEGANIDQTTDIFSLGIILWELIADDRLFVANNELNILKRIKECDIPDLRKYVPTVPFELERIVKKALAKDKHLRYQSAADFQKDLTRFLNREYPDFTPNDFSTYVKYLFENEYKQTQTRLVELSRVTLENLGGPEKLEITNTLTERVTRAGVDNENSSSDTNLPKLDFKNPAELSVVQDTKKTAVVRTREVERTSTNFTRRERIEGSYNQGYSSNTVSKSMPSARELMPESQFKVSYFTVTILSIVALIVGAKVIRPNQDLLCTLRLKTCEIKDLASSSKVGLKLRPFDATLNPIKLENALIYINRKVQTPTDGVYLVDPNTEISLQVVAPGFQAFYKKIRILGNQTQNEDIILTPQASLVKVGSNPLAVYSGDVRARIFLNAVDTRQFTPSNIMVDLNKPVSITLTAENYCPQTTQVTPTGPAQTVQVRLIKCPTAYLNIKAVQVGTNPKVYVDNLLLNEQLPINFYAVPAGRPIEIRLEDEFRGADKKIITLREHEKRDLTLIPTFSNR